MPFSARPIRFSKKMVLLEMTLSCNGDTEIPNAVGTYNNSTYSCINPGAFTLDGNTGYCFKTHTTKDTVLRDKSVFFLRVLMFLPKIFQKHSPQENYLQNWDIVMVWFS